MNQNNVLYRKEIELLCNGTGETLEKAIESAFADMRANLVKKIDYPIISINTKEVFLIEHVTENKEEAFLFIFSKRERITEKLQLKVVIDISYLKI